jgi:hypothetical protein
MDYFNNFVDSALLSELRRKNKYIQSMIEDEERFRTRLLTVAHEDAAYHSLILEPDHARNSRKVGRRKDARQNRPDISSVQKYASRTFNGLLTDSFILEIAAQIEPKNEGIYRSSNVCIAGYPFDNPPRYEKVPEQMDALLSLSNNPLLDSIERAVLFHFHFLRIHPLLDGNGRTSRFIQNLMLIHEGYAPAFLPSGERSFYNELIHNARQSFKDRESTGLYRAPELMGIPPSKNNSESVLLNYLASKVNTGMDALIDSYDALPYYQIDLKGFKNPDEVRGIKKIISRYFSHRGGPSQVIIRDLKQGRIEIRADIDDRTLTTLLNEKTNLRYTIHRFD